MSDSFYRRFEEVHRGPREVIRKRLQAYQPFLAPLARLYPEGQVLDLGCGRGEWLEVVQEHGFQAHGVDLDEGMLAAAREQGLSVSCGDALAALAATPDATLAVVSAFHLVEHIPFESVRQLVAEAQRALKPGGLLILETPNAENPWVGLSSFYLDPSHLRPVPHGLLQFVADDAGFARSRVVRLQESPHVAATSDVTLTNVLFGPSPDYAVVAQKAGESDQQALFDTAFSQQFGLALDVLAGRFDQRLQGRFDAANSALFSMEERLRLFHEHMDFQHDCLRSHDDRLNALNAQLEARIGELHQQLDHLSAFAETVARRSAEQAEQLIQLHQSASWRVTAPLRRASLVARRLLRSAIAQPQLRRLLGLLLRPFPGVRARIVRIAYSAPATGAAATTALQSVVVPVAMRPMAEPEAEDSRPADLSALTPRARQIYHDLAAALTKE